MHIDSKISVEGYPQTRIRDCLKKFMLCDLDVRSLANELKATQAQASKILEWLIVAGYIEKDPQNRKGSWHITLLGGRFANASAAKPINRSMADHKLAEFIGRVKDVNHSKEWAYTVFKVWVFGSYLTNSSTVNDIDLMVELQPLFEDQTLQNEREAYRKDLAYSFGKRFPNITAQVYWPQSEVLLFLKARSRAYHLIDPKDNLRPEPIRLIHPPKN